MGKVNVVLYQEKGKIWIVMEPSRQCKFHAPLLPSGS